MIHKFLALNFNNSGAFLKRNSGELLYLLSQYSVPTVAFFVNFLIMKYVGPETIGSYQAVILWGSYFSFLQLGVFNGLNRNLAYYKGANRTDDLQKATSTGFLFSLGVSVISLFVVFFIATTSINDGSETVLLAFIFLGVSALMQPVITFFDTLYRTGQDFRRLGKFNLIENGVFLLSSGMMMIWGYAGFVIQNIVKLIVGFSLRYFGKIKTISITFDLKVLMVQINTGFPILLNS
jgi:O-antigen/teichoic acid export membrane protein